MVPVEFYGCCRCTVVQGFVWFYFLCLGEPQADLWLCFSVAQSAALCTHVGMVSSYCHFLTLDCTKGGHRTNSWLFSAAIQGSRNWDIVAFLTWPFHQWTNKYNKPNTNNFVSVTNSKMEWHQIIHLCLKHLPPRKYSELVN